MEKRHEENTDAPKITSLPAETDNAAIAGLGTTTHQTAKNIIRSATMQPQQSQAPKY